MSVHSPELAASMASSALETETVAMLISPKPYDQVSLPISFQGEPLQIGVTVSSELSWSNHINGLASKLSRKIGALRRVFRQLSVAARRFSA